MNKCQTCNTEASFLSSCPRCGMRFCSSCIDGMYCRDCKRQRDDEDDHISNLLDPLNPIGLLNPASPISVFNIGD